MLYFAFFSVKKHVKNNKITKCDNLFLKPFIPSDKPSNNYLYYLDIRLSKYKMYERGKEYFNTIRNQFTEFCSIALKASEQNAKEFAFTLMAPTPQDMMRMIPMILAQKNKPIPKPINPLLYDSDEEPNANDLLVD